VFAAGIVAYLTGFRLIGGLDMTGAYRLALGAFWCADACITLARLRIAAGRIALIRVSIGGIAVLRPDGRRIEAELQTVSTVWRRLAWLRLACEDGARHHELVFAQRTDPDAWHRLQLLWQLRDRGFGHPGGA